MIFRQINLLLQGITTFSVENFQVSRKAGFILLSIIMENRENDKINRKQKNGQAFEGLPIFLRFKRLKAFNIPAQRKRSGALG